jgi:hypothetical protein
MTYKEAKRKWRKGIRAFKFGDEWVAKDLARFGFTRSKLMEAGRAYYEILKYCSERNLDFRCRHIHPIDSYELVFCGRSVDGKRYCVSYTVTRDSFCYCGGSLMDLVHHVLDKVNRRLQEFVFPSVIKKPGNVESLHPRMSIHPWNCQSVEQVLGAIVEKECNA